MTPPPPGATLFPWGTLLPASVRTTGNERGSFGMDVVTCLRVRAGWGPCALIAVKRAVIIPNVPYPFFELLQISYAAHLSTNIPTPGHTPTSFSINVFTSLRF